MIVSATHTVFVARSPEFVWELTQDDARRPEWDRGIPEARVLSSGPLPRVGLRECESDS